MSEPQELYLYAVVSERGSRAAIDVFRWTLDAEESVDVAQNIGGMVLQLPARLYADFRRED